MHLSLSNTQAEALANYLKTQLSGPAPINPVLHATLSEILSDLLDAIDEEAERQHLARSYPEGGY